LKRKKCVKQLDKPNVSELNEKKERETRRQAIIKEERRSLVVARLLVKGLEAVKYLPKGVLKESDLDYLPKSFREVILGAPQ
jgi:hypothetical protein